MKQLRVIYQPENMLVGTLLQSDRQILFEYEPSFIESGLNLSPYTLPLQRGIQKSKAAMRHGLHGLFDDSLPDGWGLLLMDRELRKQGYSGPILPMDRLAYIGDSAMGALRYEPAFEPGTDHALLDICVIAEQAVRFYEGDIDQVLPVLARAGGSPGGARPKVLVGINDKDQMISGERDLADGFDHWIIKFAARHELETAGRHEYDYYLMAKAAGLSMMESRLFEVDGISYFGTRRFDRQGNRRIHMQSAGNLVDADFRQPSMGYLDLCRLSYDLTRNYSDMLMMYRMMTFNVLAHNRDDHVKNFSFLMDDAGEWRLAPAYDLTRSEGPGGEHTTDVAGKGKDITRSDMLKVADAAGIDSATANEILEQVEEAVSGFLPTTDGHAY
jgi:serine/threonine-protein kinase HipA